MRTEVKTPSDKRTYSYDFVSDMPSGATISSATVTAIRQDTGESASSIVTTASPTAVGTTVPVTLQSGLANVDYVVTVLATLSDNEILAGHIRLRVRAAAFL